MQAEKAGQCSVFASTLAQRFEDPIHLVLYKIQNVLEPRISAIIGVRDLGIFQEQMKLRGGILWHQIFKVCVIVAVHGVYMVEAQKVFGFGLPGPQRR